MTSIEQTAHQVVVGRKRRIFRQFIQFGVVGASGFVVNQVVFVLAKKLTESGWDIHVEDPFMNLLGSEFHMRWYHVFSIVAFLVANIWNFCLNRFWTFKGEHKNAWWKQLPLFMAVGVFGLVITLMVQTALVNPESPIALPSDIFDNSTGLRTKSYWGNCIGVIVAVPANFVFNKLWTFRNVKAKPSTVKAVKRVAPRTAQGDS
ncbi:GtrA family protein [Corynebacterium sp. zg254]|uniref:GtrA family protein n=1 Tax=Corynebacterium zhongnanshanii TaxID=2768834 RepID=A0ABQ6VFK4_9CORY|nr:MULTISPECIES: GtrA family protein [Corynebacterium]KAB3519230.1 GtrA family protein [Corynebacterium zhongnanshanii]MCR5915084.1 GtrA family protein [Corynebacterium sp. zg254]